MHAIDLCTRAVRKFHKWDRANVILIVKNLMKLFFVRSRKISCENFLTRFTRPNFYD